MEAPQAGDPELAVPLPPTVDESLRKICAAQGLPPVDSDVRRRLAERGESGAVDILRKVEAMKIKKTLGGYIIRLLELYPQSSSPAKTRVVSAAGSPSPNRSPGSSPQFRTVRLYSNPKEAVICPCSTDVDEPSTSEIGRAEKEALGELEFRKQFLILNYIGGNELHTVTTAEEIRSLNNCPIEEFEVKIWERFGRSSVSAEDRRLYHDWNPQQTHLYDCHVSAEGIFRFKGPFLNKPRTHLQNVLGDDNVLRVKFAEDAENLGIGSLDHHYPGYRKIAIEDGISVGLRRYFFFVFKDGGKEDKKKNPTSSSVKCYFIRLHSDAFIDKIAPYILFNKTISQARSLFMHAHTLPNAANYMARFSLILSKTYSLGADLSSVKMKIEDDFYCLDECGNRICRDEKQLIHSDGTGEISEDLALMCPKNIHQGLCMDDKDIEVIRNCVEYVDSVAEAERLRAEMQEPPPMLIPCRLFNIGYAIKGTFLVNKKLPLRTIKARKSMVKVEPDEELPNYFPGSNIQNSLEIVGTSNRPKRTHLSRNLIALLSCGGVPDRFFMELLEDALRETDGAFSNKKAAMQVAMNHGKSEDFMIVRMIASGLPLEEPYLQHRLTLLLKERKTSLREGRIYIPESYYLMGTVDPTGELESNEVCIVLDNGQVSGKVIVYRNPGLHFGDVRVLKATYVKELESVVGNAKYAIFFSRKGPRSVADEMAGGDFDGDMYWVSRHPMVLNHFKPSEPWIPNPTCKVKDESKKANQFSEEEFENELFKRFLTLRFNPSFAMGEAAESCQALMDRFLTLENDCADEKNHLRDNIIKLNDIYSLALDAPKKGLKVEVPKVLKAKSFPHYMEKKNSYTSNSILGRIYDRVIKYQEEDDSSKEIWKLPQFEVDVPQDCMSTWESYYEVYRKEMSQAMSNQDRDLKNVAAGGVKKKYKNLLYGAEELEARTRNIEDIYNEALAIYHVCYNYAIVNHNASLCSFAWSVAGSALYQYLISKEVVAPPILFSPSAFSEMLGRKP